MPSGFKIKINAIVILFFTMMILEIFINADTANCQNPIDYSGYISPRISYGKNADNDFSAYFIPGIAFGYDINSKQSIELDFAIADVETDRNGKLTGLFDDNARILYAGINHRYFLTSRHELPGIYIIAGLAYNSLYWNYIKGTHDRKGKDINSDELDGTEFTFGMGMTVFSLNHFDFRLEALPSVVIWDDRTDSDIDHGFNPGRLIKLRVSCDFYLPD